MHRSGRTVLRMAHTTAPIHASSLPPMIGSAVTVVDGAVTFDGAATSWPIVKAVSYTHLTLPTNREV